MSKKLSMGKCENCGEVVAKNVMTKHIKKCVREKEAAESGGAEVFHIVVEARGGPMYWLHLDVPVSATLRTLDGFLRDIWLECCGHLSMFSIDGMDYYSQPDKAEGEMGMNVKALSVMAPGMKFRHEYDFGSTTELALKAVAAHTSAKPPRGIRLLARNEPPDMPCGVCGKPAVHICVECLWEGGGLLCADCVKTHKCGEDMLLPVVNSPRTGVCGYCG